MPSYWLTDDEWVEKWLACGSAVKMSKETGISQRSIYNRRRAIEARKKMLEGQLPDGNNDVFSKNHCGYCKNLEYYGGTSDRH